ncbi:phenylalanine-tRNA ligase, alpha subunit [Verruconis gallopava]|uniref:phenylalanine--tRNA ligase n=1 Tax=Verruconis gallopava TaxID=253628 RepID=A0A0D2AS80_9PEZI|nr:phenylalanine-tRNA ligase, alpha subunit [Verruconis gallopava]KIW09538.1 phenylalanine-tRNA ligase, alpha subunit [Verruconis gallopava]
MPVGGTRGPVPVPSKAGSRDLTKEILEKLESKTSINTAETFSDVPQIELKAALDRLNSRSMIEYDQKASERVVLEPEGEEIVENGSHEYRVFMAIKSNGKIAIKDLPNFVGPDVAKFGQQNAMKHRWLKKDGDSLSCAVDDVEDVTKHALEKARATGTISDPKLLADFKKKKLVKTQKSFTYIIRKGEKYAREIPVEHTDLTSEMLANGSWENANFKPYNFKALGASQDPGALHPLMKVREEFRKIFFNQGFVEMPTGRFVESNFWNFETLFVPQQHPARDSQDTFFIKDPPKADPPREDPQAEAAMEAMEASSRRLYESAEKREKKPRNYQQYFSDVEKVHTDGAFGSVGYRAPFDRDEALGLVLRTHTTAISSWVLHRLSEDPRPARYFSIDRVFRNEAVDNTHLAEFHQVEGVIADYGLTLGGLMKFMEDFFGKLGISGLKFKPAYNPYTEPSMEIFGFHEGLGKLIEIGNSGMFRPEMLLPMGLPKDLRVYGFGLSLERPTMIRYKVSNIRELLGHKVDLSFVEAQPAVRLDKN